MPDHVSYIVHGRVMIFPERNFGGAGISENSRYSVAYIYIIGSRRHLLSPVYAIYGVTRILTDIIYPRQFKRVAGYIA
jgi:hypothetical protein